VDAGCVSRRIYFGGLTRKAVNREGRDYVNEIEEYQRRIQTQKITAASAEKLFPKRGIRVFQNEARIPGFMPSPYHLSVCTAAAGSMNKLNALM
jgi:hypothetical protein